jgi:hypothetical protein
MPPTNASSAQASTAASSRTEPGLTCEIHQPNLFPRLSTLAKLHAADIWIVLDDVQFARRDYQHRARLAQIDEPTRQQWLSLETHLPNGRATLINEARLAAPEASRRRTALLTRQFYDRRRHWPPARDIVDQVLDTMDRTDLLADVTEASTLGLLHLLSWSGAVARSRTIVTRTGRSDRLADLCAATGSTIYLCGTGGQRYLAAAPFEKRGISIVPFPAPRFCSEELRELATRVTALHPLVSAGLRCVLPFRL